MEYGLLILATFTVTFTHETLKEIMHGTLKSLPLDS